MSTEDTGPEGADLVGLRVDNVRKEYQTPTGPLVVFEDVAFTLSPGETLAIVGPSGAGKSTLLNIIGSLDEPTEGTVKLGDQEITGLGAAELAAFRSKRVGFVFQDHHLLPQCTALENVLLPTLAAERAEDAASRAKALLDRVGLAERMLAFPSQLSGGERQRVAIARALINQPSLLLCDEPTGNLDHDTGERIGSLFIELGEERKVILIMVTHNLALARRFSRGMELQAGRLREKELANEGA